jgi:hypothetical protein
MVAVHISHTCNIVRLQALKFDVSIGPINAL